MYNSLTKQISQFYVQSQVWYEKEYEFFFIKKSKRRFSNVQRLFRLSLNEELFISSSDSSPLGKVRDGRQMITNGFKKILFFANLKKKKKKKTFQM